MRIHNFSAGPSILAKEVFEEASKSILNFNNSGLSILELSHRSNEIVSIMEEARSLVLELMGLNDEYSVLFLQGGASSQFYMIAMNILAENETAAIVNTGKWSQNAIKESKLFGNVDVIASSEKEGFNNIPKFDKVDKKYKYLHITTNNTIFGTQFHYIPESDCSLIGDMSSDVFSRKWDYSKYDLIYAGAQKNLGPAGATLLVIKKEILGKVERQIPSMLDYQIHISKDSSYNTPPVFAVYVSLLTLRWIKKVGIDFLEDRNKRKAELLYNEIDRNELFAGFAKKEDRSLMNVTFVMEDANRENEFIAHCKKQGVVNIIGHRSVGGFRASIYNAMDFKGVETLVSCMKTFI